MATRIPAAYGYSRTRHAEEERLLMSLWLIRYRPISHENPPMSAVPPVATKIARRGERREVPRSRYRASWEFTCQRRPFGEALSTNLRCATCEVSCRFQPRGCRSPGWLSSVPWKEFP